MLDLTQPELELFRILFEALPLEQAMPALLPRKSAGGDLHRLAEAVCGGLINDDEKAAIWLYVDDLDRCHQLCQNGVTKSSKLLHAVMHRREGDFSNSKYWFRSAGTLPFKIERYEPNRFVDEVANDGGKNEEKLVRLQRREWTALFGFCRSQEGGI